MKINHLIRLLLGRAVLLLVAATCFGAVQPVSGQVEIGPRIKPTPKKAPKAAPKPGLKLGHGASKSLGDTVVDLGGGVRIEMVVVPAGRFDMGSNTGRDDERPVHLVTISKPYLLGKYEVTQPDVYG